MFCLYSRAPHVGTVSTEVSRQQQTPWNWGKSWLRAAGWVLSTLASAHMKPHREPQVPCTASLTLRCLAVTVNLTESRITREEDLNEGLPRSGWPLGVSVEAYLDFVNRHGKAPPTMSITIP